MVPEPITPEQMRTSVAPVIGEGPAVDVTDLYPDHEHASRRSIAPENSAQKLRGITGQ